MWNSTLRMADHQVHHSAVVLQIGTPSQLHNIISHGAITPQTISHFTVPPTRLYQMLISEKLAERTTINEWQQYLTPTNVADVSHTTWPNPYKSPE
jgi:hypothetical protein